jgi:hypothetical protein
MKTSIYKGYYGWTAETGLNLPDNRFAKITTMKRHGGNLATTITVGTSNGDFFSTVMFQDYNKTLISEKVRVTEKAVKNQHQKALDDLTIQLDNIKRFYDGEPVAI